MRVLAVTHGPAVQPELFGDVVVAEGHELSLWDIRTQGAPPSGFDAVLVFGGDQNVGEELRHPWLHDEYAALRSWVEAGTPLFTVCLGAQTLARAFGSEVASIGTPLAGFYETTLTDEGVADAVLGALPRRFEALNANGYAFTWPSEAVRLADGPVPQAYRLGSRAWAVQFHPEVRRDQVLDWFREEASLPRPIEEIEQELDEKLAGWQELGRRLARAFLQVADD
jgi:GMP synthase-like glutamine amidotransferase